MKFYTSISEYYDLIFPYSSLQHDFILKLMPAVIKPDILDIGCATGTLLINLASHGISGTGIDLDEGMIMIANKKAFDRNLAGNIKFYVHDMRHLSEKIFKGKYDMITCLGNTLVHLLNPVHLAGYFTQVKKNLKPGGVFIIQVINYDRILKKNLDTLPVIENDQIRFERSYSPVKGGFILFKTKLIVKDEGRIIENETMLNPLTKNDLQEYLTAQAFKNTEFYGDYDFAGVRDDSLMLVIKTEE